MTLRMVRGVVQDASLSTITEINKSAGKDAEISTKSTDVTELWLTCDGKEVPIKGELYLPFRPGHTAVVVMHDSTVLFMRNETSDQAVFADRLLWWEVGFFSAALLVGFTGLLGMLLVGGGAPILHILIPMMLCPVFAGLWVWRARKGLKAKIWAMASAPPVSLYRSFA